MRAMFGIAAKVGLNAGANAEMALLIYAIAWTPIGLVYYIWRERNISLTWQDVRYGAPTGTVLCVVANFLIAAIKLEDASIVIPIANLSFVVALLISAGLGMEKLSWRKWQAVMLAGVAIFLFAKV